MLEPGDKLPAFTLKDQDGGVVRSTDLKGRWTVLYFYPNDDTPGCTREACAFRDEYSALKKAGAAVYGLSANTAESHQRFMRKYRLNFPLLVDEGHQVASAFGAWGPKVLYGRRFMGMIRSTFLVDPKGKIARVWPKVKVDGHVEQVAQALAEVQAA
jgi:peroxiredoxin Q/BCP